MDAINKILAWAFKSTEADAEKGPEVHALWARAQILNEQGIEFSLVQSPKGPVLYYRSVQKRPTPAQVITSASMPARAEEPSSTRITGLRGLGEIRTQFKPAAPKPASPASAPAAKATPPPAPVVPGVVVPATPVTKPTTVPPPVGENVLSKITLLREIREETYRFQEELRKTPLSEQNDAVVKTTEWAVQIGLKLKEGIEDFNSNSIYEILKYSLSKRPATYFGIDPFLETIITALNGVLNKWVKPPAEQLDPSRF